MYRVLVPIDHSEDRALAQAKYVANLPDATNSVEAVLLYVFTPEDDEGVPDEWEPFKSVTRVASVSRAREYLEDRDVEVRLLDDSGEAADDILDAADQYDVEEIVMGGRKRSPTSKALFGSVTQKVILGSWRPVVVTGGERE